MTKCTLNLSEQDQTKLTFESISILTPYLINEGSVIMKIPVIYIDYTYLVFHQSGRVSWVGSPGDYTIIRPLTKEESVSIYGVK